METEKGRSSRGWGEGVKQLVPRARRDEGKSWTPPFSLGVALSFFRAPFPGLWGIGNLYSSIWDSRAEIEARKFFVGEPGPYWESVKGEEEGRRGEERKGPSSAGAPAPTALAPGLAWSCLLQGGVFPMPPSPHHRPSALSPLGPQLSPGPTDPLPCPPPLAPASSSQPLPAGPSLRLCQLLAWQQAAPRGCWRDGGESGRRGHAGFTQAFKAGAPSSGYRLLQTCASAPWGCQVC